MSNEAAFDQRRQPFESAAGWANRMRRARAEATTDMDHRRKLESLEWVEGPTGELRLQQIRYRQTRMDLEP